MSMKLSFNFRVGSINVSSVHKATTTICYFQNGIEIAQR
uniref:Uncharacterized protein n=1 Tax=Rhizophora mucronata TaxID=61149 RepID=A0A2P2NTS9_RHIMU